MKPKGLGHVIYTAKRLIGNERIVVLLSDDIVDSNTLGIKHYEEVSNYGIVEHSNKQERFYEISNM